MKNGTLSGAGRALLCVVLALAALALTTTYSFAGSSTTSLRSTPNPSTAGQSVTFKAAIMPAAGGAVTGTVIFKDGATDISGGVALDTVGLGFPLIAGGESHTCALQGSGGAKCWGSGGLLGNGTYDNSNIPTSALLADAIAISAGSGHTCALGNAGGVKCWGPSFAQGQLGNGGAAPSPSPTDVHGVGDVGLLSGIRAIGVGFSHTCAVTDAGGIKCWGSNVGGVLGDGTTDTRFTPVDVVGVGGVGLLSDVKAVAAGYNHTCALTNAGGVKCWGSNSSFGQLGDGTFVDSLTPVNVSGLTSGAVAIGAGAIHTCAVLSDGGVKCWGRGAEGQVGNNTFNSSIGAPLDVVGVGNVGLLSGISALDLGYYHTCALANDGGVLCWGFNSDGEIGDGTTTSTSVPIAVSGISGASAVGVGSYHSCAVTNAGVVKCWGRNNSGQLGDGTTTNSGSPVDAAPLEALLFGGASFSTTALATGSRSVTAEYSGDINHAASTSDPLTQVVDPIVTSTALVPSIASPSVFGQSVTFTATVTGGTPTGTVTFSVNNVEQATVQLSVGGTAEYQTSSLAAGFAHGVFASYNGDPTHGTSSGIIFFYGVDKGATTATVGAAPNPSTPGEQVTFTATVAVTAPAAGTPSGTVTFNIDGTNQTPVAVSGNQALLNTTALAVGEHTITAVYNGDASFFGSTSSDLTQTVAKTATTTSLGSSDTTTVSGQSVTFTATVAGSGATGTVTFKRGSTTLGSDSVSAGTASFTTSSLAVGPHTITAVYGGDGNFATSTSSGLTQTVAKGATAIALTATPNPARADQSVKLTATVSVTAPASGTPAGAVTFKEGATTLGAGTIAAGKASLTLSALKTGSHTVTASYAGTSSLAASSRSATFKVGPNVGVEFRVNTLTANSQWFPAVTRTVSGFVVVWASRLQDGSGYGVYGQRYTAAGAKAGAEFRVNTTTTNDQSLPSIAALTNGGFVVTWQSNVQDGSLLGVHGQRYTAAGAKAGVEFLVNTATIKSQSMPSVAALVGGGFVVAWQSDAQDTSLLGIYAQRFTAAGAKASAEFRVNTLVAKSQSMPSVTGLIGGGFVVTWQSDGQDSSLLGIYGQRYNANGVKLGSEFRINTTVVKSQSGPSVAGLINGGFAVVWQSDGADGSLLGIYGQRYGSTGARVGPEFRVNTVTAKHQWQPKISGFSDGGFAVTWASTLQDGSGQGVYGQVFNAAGAKVDVEFRANTAVANNQWQPVVAAFSGGTYVIVWTSNNQDGSLEGVYGQRFKMTQ